MLIPLNSYSFRSLEKPLDLKCCMDIVGRRILTTKPVKSSLYHKRFCIYMLITATYCSTHYNFKIHKIAVRDVCWHAHIPLKTFRQHFNYLENWLSEHWEVHYLVLYWYLRNFSSLIHNSIWLLCLNILKWEHCDAVMGLNSLQKSFIHWYTMTSSHTKLN